MTKMDNTMDHMSDMFKDNLASDRRKAIAAIQAELRAEENPDGWEFQEVQ